MTHKNLDRRLNWEKIFNPNAKLPETEDEFFKHFDKILCDLSPENLCCDGEISASAARKKASGLHAEWRELERLFGRKVTEDEIYGI